MHVAPLFNSQPRLLYLVKPQKQMPLTLSPLPSGTSNGPKPMQPIQVRFLGQKAEWRKVESGPKVALADIQHIKFPKTCFCLSLHCAKFSDINIAFQLLFLNFYHLLRIYRNFHGTFIVLCFYLPRNCQKKLNFLVLDNLIIPHFPLNFFTFYFSILLKCEVSYKYSLSDI